MDETRASKYGRNLAIVLNAVLDSIPANSNYRKVFLNELQTYSLEPRKKGMPIGTNCTHELADIENVTLANPKQLAKLVKEGIHLMYQKQTARKVLYSLLENL